MVRIIFKKIKNTIFIFMMFMLLFSSLSVKMVLANKNFYELEETHYNSFPEYFDISYNLFLESIGKNDLLDVNTYWLRLRDYNDKLIIGGSGVVWCGDTMKDGIDLFGYDVVGFGGMTDNKIKEWVPKIKKKYKKIIIFEGVNTINLATGLGMKSISKELVDSVATTIVKAQNELLDANGELLYVKVKPMIYPQDNDDKKKTDTFNKMSAELNVALSAMNVNLYELKYPTTKEYSNGYVHYNNKIVWEDMLRE